MPDNDKDSKIGIEALIARFLQVAGIPTDEWPSQTRKLLGTVDASELEAKLSFLEGETSRMAAEIEAAIPFWEKEEKERKQVAASGLPGVRNWLQKAITSKNSQPTVEAFAPFQDEVRNDTAFEDLYILYLSLPEPERLCWNEAIVDVASDFLSTAPKTISTYGLLKLVGEMDELPKLAMVASAPVALLDAQCKGKIELSPKVALSVFREGCTLFPMLWANLFKLGDQIFSDYLEAQELSREDFLKAGNQVGANIHPREEAELLAETVAITDEWRRHFLAPLLPAITFAEPTASFLKLGSPELMRPLLAQMAAISAQIAVSQNEGAVQ